MANEATVRSSLQIRKGSLTYQGQPTAFVASVTGSKGPSPGAVTISTAGTDINFGELVEPGLCRIMNLDATHFVEYGVWYPDAALFFPVGEILPGESYVLRLSRNLQEDYIGTGTGTSAPNNRFRFKANLAPVVVLVEAFER